MKILNEDIKLIWNTLLNEIKNNPNDEHFFIKTIDFINQNEIFFDSKTFIEIFNLITDENKKHYIEILIDKCTVKREFSTIEIELLLKQINNNAIRFDIFSLLLNSSFFPNYQLNDLIIIMNLFKEKKYLTLDLLFNEDKVKNIAYYQFDEFIMKLPENERKDTIIYLRKKIPEKLDDRTLLWVIQFLNQDDTINIFKEFVINDINFNEEILFKNISIENNANLTFLLLDLYIGEKIKKYNNLEKKQLYKRTMQYIIDFKEVFGEEYPNELIIYQEINNLVSQEYKVNIDNLNQLIRFFGYETFNYLECSNIKKLLNLEQDKFDLIMNLFKENNIILDQHTLNNVLNSFYQREFLFERKEEYLTFAEFDKYITEQNNDKILNKIKLIQEKINIYQILNDVGLNINEFVQKLLVNDCQAKEILHIITNKYIMKCREDFVINKINTAHLELNLDYRIERNKAKKLLFSNTSVDKLTKLLFSIDKSKLSKEQIELLNNQELLEKVILYKINPTNKKHSSEFYKNLSYLEKMVNILWEDGKINFETNNHLEYVYFPKKVNKTNLLAILAELDINQLSKTIISNKILYENLCIVLEKYKILSWGNTFDDLSRKIDLTIDTSTIAALINYFYIIYPEIENNINLTKMLAYADCYSSVSNKFKYLLGDEDYQLICANTGNYKAPAPKTKRLELAMEHLQEMYFKEKVTIPSYDKNYILKNGKIINVVVGNSTSIKNLTIGERTDSCLRICGIFYELFKFIIKDKNGFNICFYDQDGEFVSRVSGIRNGNTVFLNQLRNSLNSKITNNDLYELLKLVSNDLLVISADSPVPIDNVVISPQEALRGREDEKTYIGDDIFKNNLYNLPFNYDIDEGYALLLASRGNGEYIRKDIYEKLPEYKCCNDKITYIEDAILANKRYKQFYLINQILNGIKIDETKLPDDEIISCISSDKFIIVKTINNELNSFILDKFSNDIEIHTIVEKLVNDLKYINNGGMKR